MKMITSVLSFFAFASIAHATPAVGDRASFTGTWGADQIQQVLAFTEYNTSTKQFKKLTVTKIGADAPVSQESWVNLDDTASDAALNEIVNNCAYHGGVSMTITVPAGTFKTCKMPLQGGGTVYFGQVPFAVVRIEAVQSGKQLIAVLSGAVRGNP